MCIIEFSIILTQLLFESNIKNHLYLISGSYHNPAPLGGFLAISISILFATKDYLKDNRIIYFLMTFVIYCSIIILPSTMSRAAIISLLVSFFLWSINTKQNTVLILKKHKYSLIIASLLLIVVLYLIKKPSADGRFFMFLISFRALKKSPFWGNGLGTFAGLQSQEQALYFKQAMTSINDSLDLNHVNETFRMVADSCFLSFNEIMKIGIEQGWIVMLLFILLLLLLLIYSFVSGNSYCYGLLTLILFSCFSYPFSIWSFLLILGALIALCVIPLEDVVYRPLMDYFFIGFMFALTLVVLGVMTPHFCKIHNSEKQWELEPSWSSLEMYDCTVKLCDELYEDLSYDYKFMFDYGKALNKISEYDKSDSILRKGLELCGDPMFWNVMGNNSIARGRYREAEERYMNAFYMVPNRLYPLYLLAKLYYQECDTARFLKMSEKIDSFKPKVESATTNQFRQEIKDLKITFLKQ